MFKGTSLVSSKYVSSVTPATITVRCGTCANWDCSQPEPPICKACEKKGHRKHWTLKQSVLTPIH